MSEGPPPRLRPVRRLADFDWEALRAAARAEGCGGLERLLAELGEEGARDRRAGLWAIAAGGRAVAAAGVAPEPCPGWLGAARLWAIYVHPDHRGRGFGHRLLARILRHLRGRFRRLTARVEDRPTASFLEHHGFVPLDDACVSHFRLVGKG